MKLLVATAAVAAALTAASGAGAAPAAQGSWASQANQVCSFWIAKAKKEFGSPVTAAQLYSFAHKAQSLESKELVAGFWLWEVRSLEEAIEWVKRCPNPMDGESEIEIRQVFEAEDFGAEFTPELREQEERVRAEAAKLGKKR